MNFQYGIPSNIFLGIFIDDFPDFEYLSLSCIFISLKCKPEGGGGGGFGVTPMLDLTGCAAQLGVLLR